MSRGRDAGGSSAVLRRTETGYLVTELSRRDDGRHDLLRLPGERRLEQRLVSQDVLERVAADMAPYGAAPSGREGGGARYLVPGPASLALLLEVGMDQTALCRLAVTLGEVLAAAHGSAPLGLDAPAGAVRVRNWLAGQDVSATAGRARSVLAEALGPDALSEVELVVRRWACTDQGSPSPRLLLGAPGSQSVWPDPHGGAPTVLVTDELAQGDCEWDLGWFIGELWERSLSSATPERLWRAAGSLLASHARREASVEPRRVAEVVMVRVLTHLHDYAAFVGWEPTLIERARAVADWVRPNGTLLERWCSR